ncbi:MAG: hypothetical protein JNL81_12925 [Hyphomonadaceae bacterium]|nr:hypothetical protein [Hyphomonadaceae bacterium]
MRTLAISMAILALASCGPPPARPPAPTTPEEMAERANDLHMNAGARAWLLATSEERDAVAQIWAAHYISLYTDRSIFDEDSESVRIRHDLAAQIRTCTDRAITETSSLSVLDRRLMEVGYECVDQIARQNGDEPRQPN